MRGRRRTNPFWCHFAAFAEREMALSRLLTGLARKSLLSPAEAMSYEPVPLLLADLPAEDELLRWRARQRGGAVVGGARLVGHRRDREVLEGNGRLAGAAWKDSLMAATLGNTSEQDVADYRPAASGYPHKG